MGLLVLNPKMVYTGFMDASIDKSLLHSEVDKAKWILDEDDFYFLHEAIDNADEHGLSMMDGHVVKVRPEKIIGMRDKLLN